MQRLWSHAVALLLGITLAVGFYEGRRLVTNTMRALQLGDGSAGLAARLEPDASLEPTAQAQRREDKRLRSTSRSSARAGTTTAPLTSERLSPSKGGRHRNRGPGDPIAPPTEAVDRLQVLRENGQLPMALPVAPAPAEDTGEALP